MLTNIIEMIWKRSLSWWRPFLIHFDICRNSLMRKFGREFWSSLIKSLSKSKQEKIAYHLTIICFETRLLTSIYKTYFVVLQPTHNKTHLFIKLFLNFVIHNTIVKISFVTIEYFFWDLNQHPKWYLTTYSSDGFYSPNFCLKIPP